LLLTNSSQDFPESSPDEHLGNAVLSSWHNLTL
jgi:hypothetical protein